MTVTTALFGFAHSESVLVLARLLQGASSSCSWTAGLAWLIADAPANARGTPDRKRDGRRDLRRDARAGDRRDRSLTSIEGTFAGVACIGLGLAVWAFATSSQHEPSGQPVSLLFSALTKPRMLAGVWLVALPSISFGALGVLAPLHLDTLGLGALAISGVWIVAISFEATRRRWSATSRTDAAGSCRYSSRLQRHLSASSSSQLSTRGGGHTRR
jgi:hypothetical protein